MASLKAYMMIGIPGIGKSTYAKNWKEECPDSRQIIASDEVRKDLYGSESIQGDWNEIIDEMEYQIMLSSAALKDIIIDATHTNRLSRKNMIHLLWKNGYNDVIGVWFKPDIEKAINQDSQRSRHVPHHIIRKMADRLKQEPPKLDEGFIEIIGA